MPNKVYYGMDLGLAADGVTERKYAIKLFEACYKDFASIIGLTKLSKSALKDYSLLKIKQAVENGYILPLRLVVSDKKEKITSPRIFVARDKVEEALKQFAFKGKKYNGKDIQDCRPITRVVTTY